LTPAWGKKLVRLHVTSKLGMEAHVCNPSYMEGIGRRIKVLGWPGQKV
jgi:hypothetical protein